MSDDCTPARRLAFRFGVVYLALFCLATQISGSLIPNPWFPYRGLGRVGPVREVTHWVARTLFAIDVPLDDVSGGETLFFWIQWSWVLAVAIAITVVWTLLAKRRSYDSWLPGLRVVVRLVLAASLLEYGMTKVIPTQFPAPPLTALVTPAGGMTLSALLWTTIGSAPAYQITTGCVEVLAGVLLLLPWTATFGALLALISLAQVLLLNLTFDIGVKLVTTHLIVLAVILVVPMVRLKPDTTLAVRLKADTTGMVAIVLIAFGAYLLGMQTWINWSFWQVGGGGRPKSVLYGIWNVERLSVDGQVRPPEANDYDRRWRRVIFDTPDTLVIQRIDDSFARYGASIELTETRVESNVPSGTIALTKGNSRTWGSRFEFDGGVDRMRVSGEMDGHRVEAVLLRVDPSAFPLLNSGFRWVRPHDP